MAFPGESVTGQREVCAARPQQHGAVPGLFSPEGRFITSGSWDGTVKLWDAQAVLFITNLIERTSRVFSVSFSADSHQLAVGGWGKMSSADLPSRTVTDRPPFGGAERSSRIPEHNPMVFTRTRQQAAQAMRTQLTNRDSFRNGEQSHQILRQPSRHRRRTPNGTPHPDRVEVQTIVTGKFSL
jgi:hypothetical protein